MTSTAVLSLADPMQVTAPSQINIRMALLAVSVGVISLLCLSFSAYYVCLQHRMAMRRTVSGRTGGGNDIFKFVPPQVTVSIGGQRDGGTREDKDIARSKSDDAMLGTNGNTNSSACSSVQMTNSYTQEDARRSLVVSVEGVHWQSKQKAFGIAPPSPFLSSWFERPPG